MVSVCANGSLSVLAGSVFLKYLLKEIQYVVLTQPFLLLIIEVFIYKSGEFVSSSRMFLQHCISSAVVDQNM